MLLELMINEVRKAGYLGPITSCHSVHFSWHKCACRDDLCIHAGAHAQEVSKPMSDPTLMRPEICT